MKMIRAVIRPEKETAVTAALAASGFPALTKWEVVGRGKQQGIQLGDHIYDGLSKCQIMIVVQDDSAEEVIRTIKTASFTGSPGDGKIFITPVEATHTIRSRKAEL